MQFAEALSYLLSPGHETLAIKLGLKNTETLLAALGNPQRTFRAVQIAGTNGKGSTAAFLESICWASGIRTGLFTSPHLVSITERIRIDGEQISAERFARLTEQVKTAAEKLIARGDLQTLPTFFEHVTAIALLAFSESNVALGILETGLGGRLDSTTAARAEIVGITPIAMDHQEYLGKTLAQIAAEKAAIIRPGVAAVIGPQHAQAFGVIIRECAAAGVEPRLIELCGAPTDAADSMRFCGNVLGTTPDGRAIVSFFTDRVHYDNVTVALRGRHQVGNAATAIAIAEILRERGFQISRQAITHGIETAVHPGRLEWWEGPPRFLFDGAHNPAAARALREYLDDFVTGPIVMIFGAMRDKALTEMMATLFARAKAVILTSLDNPRAASLDELVAAVPTNFDKSRIKQSVRVDQAVQLARNITPDGGVVCITGSLYLVGLAQEILRRAKESDCPLPLGEGWVRA